MEPFLTTITTYPAVPLTVILGVVLGYWLFALATGAAFDAADSAAGGVKAAGDATAGALKGASEALVGALKGAGEAAGGVKAAVEGAGHDHDAGELAESGVLSVLGLGRVPITITLSTASLVAWTHCVLAMTWFPLSNVLAQSVLLAVSLVVGLLGAAVLLRPLGKALDASRPARKRDFLGQLCTITSGKVDAGFGTAEIADGSAGLNVHVTCAKPNGLKKGDRALLVDFDPAKNVYEVEPVDWLEPTELQALSDPTRAAQVLSSRVRRR
ncbi:MAG: hypothetical protein ACOZQL_13225 [Myxococcota bacterium]